MRLGVITVHAGMNYGASLQAYALVNALRGIGHETYLIDYRTELIRHKMEQKQPRLMLPTSYKNIKQDIKYLMFKAFEDQYKNKLAHFDLFHQSILEPSGRVFLTEDELVLLNDSYDGFICGSDQIWNPAITSLDTTFFLRFANEDKIRAAYAPSIGVPVSSLSPKTIDVFKENLPFLTDISIREQTNQPYVTKWSGKPCASVLDPVMLLDVAQWQSLADTAQNEPCPYSYALIYQIFRDDDFFNFAVREAKRRNLRLVSYTDNPLHAKMHGAITLVNKSIGPSEFIKLFLGASCVFTSSFHGILFSILLKKPFWVAKIKGEHSIRSLRITDVLEYFSLMDHVLEDETKTEFPETDWAYISELLKEGRQHSMTYLKSIEKNGMEKA